MTLIDLGELRDVAQPERPARARPPSRRVPVFLAVLLVALVTLVASAPLPVRDVVLVPFRLGSDRMIAGELLLVVDPSDRPGGSRSVTAYRLPVGEVGWRAPLPVAWRAPLPVAGEFWGVSAVADLLLVTGYDPQAHDNRTLAVDARTGAYRWQQPGSAVATAGGGLLLEVLGEDRSGTVRAVDPCCGTLRWQVVVAAGGPTYRATGGEIDRVVLNTPGGRVEVRDAGSGRILTAADLPVPESTFGSATQVLADLLVTVDGALVTAYGLDRLDRRWQATVPDVVYVMECGHVVCAQTRSDVLAGLDARTGAPLWTRTGWNTVWAEGRHLIVTSITNTGGEFSDLVLVDPADGSVRAELGRWDLIGRWTNAEPLLAVRPRPTGGLVVAEVDAEAASVRILDVLPEAIGDCQSVDGDLLCRRRDGSLGLWRLRR
ncbi:outer membrane protein assembly factor BamB family protein [Micromonospora sp. H33]|uniref:outer membrane protein assembly factor BamB family protein n=1 Tax=Micromonospora sp. H33 TaxID=3452215 RepID=UPI003F8BF520